MPEQAEHKRYRWTPGMLDVPFLMGALGASTLVGPSLVHLLIGMGRSETAARNLLTRMTELGALSIRREGRVNDYRISGSSQARYKEVEGTSKAPVWTGRFDAVFYTVPERDRNMRDRLLHTARSSGYGLLRPGVLIAASPRRDRLSVTGAELAGESWIEYGTVEPDDLATARRMAARAWRLPEIAAGYHAGIRQCADAKADHVAPDWPTLRRWRQVYATFFDPQLSDPNLPPALLPADWPAAAFSAAQFQLNVRFGPVLLPFLRAVADRQDPEARNAYYPPPWMQAAELVDDPGEDATADAAS